jgi:tetratricopeptide (TPR) repeat protein
MEGFEMSKPQLSRHETKWLKAFAAGQSASSQGNHKKAAKLLEQAKAIAIEFSLLPEQLLNTYMCYAIALQEGGQTERSEAVYREALNYSTVNGCERTAVHMLLLAELGVLLLDRSKHVESRMLLEKYTKMHGDLNLPIQEDFLWVQVALCCCYIASQEWHKLELLSLSIYNQSVNLYGPSHSCSLDSKKLHVFALRHLRSSLWITPAASPHLIQSLN